MVCSCRVERRLPRSERNSAFRTPPAVRERLLALRFVAPERLDRCAPNRHDPLLATVAEHLHLVGDRVNIGDVELL